LKESQKKRILSSDHGQSMKFSEEVFGEFLHMVFIEFSNKDNEF
jgi:hypothetical protein